jgi:ubiquinone/menaquinone biosynthesis C-methylase UbiE
LSNKKQWESSWGNIDNSVYSKGNLISRFGFHYQKKAIKEAVDRADLSKRAKIIDVGCGSGKALFYFRDFGFRNSIGVDISNNALKICESLGLKRGKDVFLMDASKIKFKDRSFDMVFAEGLLEHFKDFTPIAKEMARLSKRYILITQPDHFTPTGKMINLLASNLEKAHVKEYDYHMSEFVEAFKKLGFDIKSITGSHLVHFAFMDTSKILLFERVKQ